jgi:PAS domain S-box-containing protein
MKSRNEYIRVILKAQKYLSEGILLFDAKQKNKPLVFINKSVSRILGCTNKELIGRNYSIFKSEIIEKEDIEKIRSCFKNNINSIVDFNFKRKDGKSIFCRISITSIPDSMNKTTYVLCVMRDITKAREKLLDKVKLSIVETTLRTVNDVIFNYFNNIQIFRWDFEKHCNLSKLKLQEFDNLNKSTMNKLKKINELKEYKEEKMIGKMSVLIYN